MDKYIGIQFFPVMDFTRVLFTSLNAKAYKYALDMTVKECNQAVEGMYHNLNTLQLKLAA